MILQEKTRAKNFSVELGPSTPIGDAGLFFVFAAVVTACLIYMFFMMPETKGITMEQIEYIFLCPPHEGCAIRRDPNRIITNAVESVTKMVERVIIRYHSLFCIQEYILIILPFPSGNFPPESAHRDHSHTWVPEEASSEREVRVDHDHGDQRGDCGLVRPGEQSMLWTGQYVRCQIAIIFEILPLVPLNILCELNCVRLNLFTVQFSRISQCSTDIGFFSYRPIR